MITINAKVIGENIQLMDSPLVASKSVQSVRILFDFDDAWDGFGRIALFWGVDDEVYTSQIINGATIVPHEAMAESGKIKFGVYGTNGTKRIVSVKMSYKIVEGAYTSVATESVEPSASLLDQIEAGIGTMEDYAQEMRDLAAVGTVRCDMIQTLTDEQKAIGRGNIDAANISSLVSRYAGRRVSIIGDSISSYTGYVPDGYPASGYPNAARGVESVEDCWWMKVIRASGAALEVNASWNGSCASNARSGRGYPDFYDRRNALGNPELILVALGTNDSEYFEHVALGEYDFTSAYTSLSEATFRTAYIKGVKALQANYPSAEIVLVTLKMGDGYAESIQTIGKKLGLRVIDAREYHCTPSTDVHPDVIGMRQIASAVLHGGEDGDGWPEDAVTALLHLFEHVAYADAAGRQYYNALYTALTGQEPEPEPDPGPGPDPEPGDVVISPVYLKGKSYGFKAPELYIDSHEVRGTYFVNAGNGRIALALDSGDHPYDLNESNRTRSPYYPIPIPSGATQLITTGLDDTVACVAIIAKYYAADDIVVRFVNSLVPEDDKGRLYDISDYNDGTSYIMLWYGHYLGRKQDGTIDVGSATDYDISGINTSSIVTKFTMQ